MKSAEEIFDGESNDIDSEDKPTGEVETEVEEKPEESCKDCMYNRRKKRLVNN